MTVAERFFFWVNLIALNQSFSVYPVGHWKSESNQNASLMEENSFWGPYIGVLPSVEEPRSQCETVFLGFDQLITFGCFQK